MTIDELARRIMRETEKCECCPTLDGPAAHHLARIALGAITLEVRGTVTIKAEHWGKLRDASAEISRLTAENHRLRYGSAP